MDDEKLLEIAYFMQENNFYFTTDKNKISLWIEDFEIKSDSDEFNHDTIFNKVIKNGLV